MGEPKILNVGCLLLGFCADADCEWFGIFDVGCVD